jgi:competence protein ComGC
MNKIILIVIIVMMFTALATAQSNTEIIQQIGNYNEIEILQSGTMNYCLAEQQGNW